MTPLDAWVARANVARLRLLIAASTNDEDKARLQQILERELQKVRVADMKALK